MNPDVPQPDPAETEAPAEKEKAWVTFKKATDTKFTELADRIEIDDPSAKYPDIYGDNATPEERLILDTDDGRRVVLSRVKPGAGPNPNEFLRDVLLSIHADNKQVDYNYGKDGIVRKRALDHSRKGNLPEIEHGDSPEEILRKAKETLKMATEQQENLQLEDEMGVNNQPVSAAELDGITTMLKNAKPVRENVPE